MLEFSMPKDSELRVFELLPFDLRELVQKHVPFGGSIFDFLRDKLGLRPHGHDISGTQNEMSSSRRKRAAHGSITPNTFFKDELLMVLYKQPGHRMRAKDAVAAVIERVRSHLKPADFEKTPGVAVTRVENNIHWAREHIKRDGFLEAPTKETRGMWILTRKGIEAAKKL